MWLRRNKTLPEEKQQNCHLKKNIQNTTIKTSDNLITYYKANPALARWIVNILPINGQLLFPLLLITQARQIAALEKLLKVVMIMMIINGPYWVNRIYFLLLPHTFFSKIETIHRFLLFYSNFLSFSFGYLLTFFCSYVPLCVGLYVNIFVTYPLFMYV